MKNNFRIVKLLYSVGLTAAIVVSVMALTNAPPAMARPTPDCGPDFSWDCTMPDGTHQFVEGTRCDIGAFQKQTGAHCVIGGGF
jgi:hypothetical protein